jgi:hypothetical protein
MVMKSPHLQLKKEISFDKVQLKFRPEWFRNYIELSLVSCYLSETVYKKRKLIGTFFTWRKEESLTFSVLTFAWHNNLHIKGYADH